MRPTQGQSSPRVADSRLVVGCLRFWWECQPQQPRRRDLLALLLHVGEMLLEGLLVESGDALAAMRLHSVDAEFGKGWSIPFPL